MKRLLSAAFLVVMMAGQAGAFWGQTISGASRAPRMLCQSAVPVSVGGTVAETQLLSCNIPALRPTDAVRFNYIIAYTGLTNSKTIKPKLAGTTLYTSTRTTAAATLDVANVTVFNRNATNSQGFATSPGTNQATTLFTMAVDTSVPTVFTVTGQTTLEAGFTPTNTNMSGTGSVITVISTAHGLNTGEYVQAAGSSTAGYNVDPVLITRIDANTFTYPGTGSGTPTTSPTIKRYSVMRLEGYTVEMLPGVP